jgi:hypothetical protein
VSKVGIQNKEGLENLKKKHDILIDAESNDMDLTRKRSMQPYQQLLKSIVERKLRRKSRWKSYSNQEEPFLPQNNGTSATQELQCICHHQSTAFEKKL